jgi:hypothetical protein
MTVPSPPSRRQRPAHKGVLLGLILAVVALLSYGSIITKVGLFGSADFVPSAQQAAPRTGPPLMR